MKIEGEKIVCNTDCLCNEGIMDFDSVPYSTQDQNYGLK
jgi:hypothetical protein